MAIDTETRRRSVSGYSSVGTMAPVPDSTIDELDRKHMVGLYPRTTIEAGVGHAAARVNAPLVKSKFRGLIE